MSRRIDGPLTDEQIAELKTRLPLNDVEYIKAEQDALAQTAEVPAEATEEAPAEEEKKTTSAKK